MIIACDAQIFLEAVVAFQAFRNEIENAGACVLLKVLMTDIERS